TRTNYYALSKNTSTSRNTKANTVRKGYLNSWKHVSRNCRQKNSTPQRRRRKINSNDNAATKRARTVGHPNDCGSLRRVQIPSGSTFVETIRNLKKSWRRCSSSSALDGL